MNSIEYRLQNKPSIMTPPTSVCAGFMSLVLKVQSGQWCILLPDEGENIHCCSYYEYMTYKWHQMHCRRYSPCILLLNLKIHLKRIQIRKMQYSHCPETTSKSSFQKKAYAYFRIKKFQKNYPDSHVFLIYIPNDDPLKSDGLV